MGLFNDVLGGIPLIGDIYSGIAGTFDAKANRRQQREQNQLDRDFTLAQWERENAYNNPKAQMQRLNEAGLNPNLVYGSGATTTAAHMPPPNSKPLPPLNTAAIGMGLRDGINAFVDLNQKRAQTDLLGVQMGLATANTRNVNQRTEKVAADMEKVLADTDISITNKKILDEKLSILQQTGLDTAREALRNFNLRNKETEINLLSLPEKNKNVVKDAYWRMKVNEARFSGQNLSNELDKVRLEMRKKGVEINDQWFFRIFSEFLPDKDDVLNYVKRGFKSKK